MKTQEEIFALISGRFKTRAAMCRYIAKEFAVSTSTVSKWGYNTTILGYDRMQKLVEKFKLGYEDVFQTRADLVTFTYRPLHDDQMESYRDYIHSFLQSHRDLVNAPDVSISFHADDVPIYHLMSSRLLIYFKLYSFACDVHRVTVSFEEFMEEQQQYGLNAIFDEIVDYYDRIPSTEIWDDWVLHTLLFQIEHFDVLERYDNLGTKNAILKDLRAMLLRFQQMATSGVKSSGVRFDFYRRHSPAKKGYMLLEGNGQTRLTLKVDTINSMSTFNQNIVSSFRKTFDATVNKSTVVGRGAERERTVFFRKLLSKIDAAMGMD